MIDCAGLDCDGENGQAIAAGGGFFRFGIAVGPENGGDSGSPIDSDGIACDGLREFAIDVDDAVWGIGRCGIGCPPATIIGRQRRRWRRIRLTKYDGERGNRRAWNNLGGITATGHHNNCQYEKQENPCAFCQ